MKNFVFFLILTFCNVPCILAHSFKNELLSVTGTGKYNLTYEAQVSLKQGDVDKALVAYSQAVELTQAQRNGGKGVKGDLMAEYAYTLALHHDFEAALLNIDRARMVGTKYGNFYAAQILTLMGYNDAAGQLMRQAKVPDWIDGIYQGQVEKYKTTASINRDTPDSALKRANRLAATKQTIQAMVLFEELKKVYPDTYIIYVDYSTVWESLGYYAYAAQLLQMGIDKMPDMDENKQVFQNHLGKVHEQAIRKTNAPLMKKFWDWEHARMMTYVGASGGKDMFSMNGRFGVYTSNKFSASLDLGMGYAGKQFSGNIGLSAYKTWGIFIAGMGFTERFSKKNSFNYTLSAGLTFLNKSQTSSFDIMVNGYIPFTKGSNPSYSISIGKTIYFDINRIKK